VDFEFDTGKSKANEAKHGIDFIEAQALWLDEMRVEIPARTADEPRFLVVGVIAERHWSAVITYRGKSGVRIRLISVRRSRPEEITIYESSGFRSQVRRGRGCDRGARPLQSTPPWAGAAPRKRGLSIVDDRVAGP